MMQKNPLASVFWYSVNMVNRTLRHTSKHVNRHWSTSRCRTVS